MKYAVWFVRLLFAAWMIPAGLNHFIPLFPQPMGNQPLSQALIIALLDSHLFDLVKAVELIAGLGVLFGFHTALALLICLPVSFNVFYWDAPLEGWGSRAALFGYSTLLCNALLCLAWFPSYRSMFTLRASVQSRQQLVLVGRLVFGAWMLLSGINHFTGALWPALTGHEPLAVQLMTALVNSKLLDVAMVIQLVAGALILSGLLLPFALCLLMPISTCALFWAAVLDQHALTALLALTAFALNGLLMLALLPYYQDVLQRQPHAIGEDAGTQQCYDTLLVDATGRTTRAEFVPALITVIAAISFFGYIVTGRTAQFCMLMLLYPAFVLLARRLRGMGRPAWWVLPPLALLLAGFGILLGYLSLGAAVDAGLLWVAVAVSAVFAVWGCINNQQA
jgi:uncharacterized membrane protein YphA (DoxX/SURF4 family)/uncharacterized membrane protein YhaH (DUF805 family)